MRGLLITLLVLAALGVGADVGARAVAEDRVGVALQGALDLPAAPEVDVHGFPFLTQALAGRYDDVEVSAPGIRYGELEDLTLTARLAGVSLPADALLAGRVDTVPADTVVAEARLDPADLARLFDAPGLTVAPVTTEELRTAAAEAADDPRGLSGSAAALRRIDPTSSVRLTSSVTVAGRTVPVSVIASFRLSGGRITLAARDIRATDPGASGALGRAASAALRGRLGGFSRTIDPGRLPFGIRAGGLRAEEGVLVVSGTARDVDLLAARR